MTRRWELGCALVVAGALTAACGKKGPPLLPYVRTPAPAEITATRRIGNDVYVTVSVPTTDIDGAAPASLAHIEVWGVTAAAPPPASQFLNGADRVETIPVARYPDPGDTSGTVVPDPRMGALQGISVTVRDSLTADEMTVRSKPAVDKQATREPKVRAAEPPGEPRRFYMTLAVSSRKRASPSKVVDVPLTAVPPRVEEVSVAMNGRTVQLQWEPAGGLLGFLLDRALPVERAPVEDDRPAPAASPQGSAAATLYNVYRQISPDPLALPPPATPSPWASVPETPVNPQPLTTLTFQEADLPFDERRRCYRVRAVRGSGGQQVESEPSEPACIVPVDTEPPATVTGLSATPVEGSITLRWEPNGEEDLGGYIVLRRGAADDTLAPLFTAPIADTRYIDRDVMAGRMYTYVVQAVDTRVPVPNVSDPAEITATAR